MDSSPLLLIGFVVCSATLLNALLAFILWNAPQLESSTDQIALRCFIAFFAAIALTHLVFGLQYVSPEWAWVCLIVSNAVYVSGYYCLYLGLCYRWKTRSVLFRSVVAVPAFILFIFAYTYLSVSDLGGPASRGALIVLCVGALLVFCLRIVPGHDTEPHQGNQLTRQALWASLALLLVLGFCIAWLDAGDIRLLYVGSLTSLVTVVLLFGAMYGSFLHDAVARYYHTSITDSLSGLNNRRYVIDESRKLLSAAKRHHAPVSIVMCDIDHFKRINDQHGHDVGDIVIKAFAQVLQSCVRTEDILARWGGEEFVILLANTDAERARVLVERIRTETGRVELGIPGGLPNFTASFGVTLMPEGMDIETGVKHADEALYHAKQGGRNRVEMYAG